MHTASEFVLAVVLLLLLTLLFISFCINVIYSISMFLLSEHCSKFAVLRLL